MSDIEFTDRYKAMGIPYPDPKTMCKGHCEGTGVYPMFILVQHPKSDLVNLPSREYAEEEKQFWIEEHQRCKGTNNCDGWHFIKCSDCNGTGHAKF